MPGWGTYGVLLGNKKYVAQAPLSQFFGAQMLTSVWAEPVPRCIRFRGWRWWRRQLGNGISTAERPDGTWAVLLVNRDLANAHQVQVVFNR